MIDDNTRATNFVESVYRAYHLDTILDEGPRKFGFKTGPNHPHNHNQVDLIIDKFAAKGITAVVKSKGIKRYPSASLTLEFSK
jgi:hypothetical protein